MNSEGHQQFFLYSRREMKWLVGMGCLIGLFCFTLGMHLGKRVSSGLEPPGDFEQGVLLEPAPEKFPNKQDLMEQAASLQEALEEVLSKLVREQVQETRLKLDLPRPVELPKVLKKLNQKPHSEGGGDSVLRSK